ncbi:hypothetical protein SHKM778_85880 [Streptomyces sp. KM77-8]|uniref:Uncharacterized protein n=1 Tax=Streptomyces haneummycinicus TaxID=3074435 RepID=A0AAT9HXT7_9ACTN
MSVRTSVSGSEPTTIMQAIDSGMLTQAAAQSSVRPRRNATRNSGRQASSPQHRTPAAAYSTRCVMTDDALGGGGAAPWPYMTAPGQV